MCLEVHQPPRAREKASAVARAFFHQSAIEFVARLSDRLEQLLRGFHLFVFDVRFPNSEAVLDGIEVGRVGRQKLQAMTAAFLFEVSVDASRVMKGSIVHHEVVRVVQVLFLQTVAAVADEVDEVGRLLAAHVDFIALAR